MFRELDLKPVYDQRIVDDLIVPLLSHADEYYRGVGFFSSGWMRDASKGLAELCQRGGKAKVICSPVLSPSDWNAFQIGDEGTRDLVVRNALLSSIDDIQSVLTEATLTALSWMIADRILEFRFAVPRRGWERGDFHDKFAVFVEHSGDRVAIHGSFNDSQHASYNAEAFSVFKSWDDGQKPFVDAHSKRFDDLWEDRNTQMHVAVIPEAVRKKLVTLRADRAKPYPSQDRGASASDRQPREPAIPPDIDLEDFQVRAIEAWQEAARRGILEMATGTGKTITALAACVGEYQRLGKAVVVVLVPYLHLVPQWSRVCQSFGFATIQCSGDEKGWPIKLRERLDAFALGAIRSLAVIAVHNTAASAKFCTIIKGADKSTTVIVADECHALGARRMQKALAPGVDMRLGLSATPRRWLDDDGTAILDEYFSGVCFEFPLEKAIGKFLTPYRYHPIPVGLTDEEEAEYASLSAQIAVCRAQVDEGKESEEKLKKLLLARARVIMQAQNKLPALLGLLRAHLHPESGASANAKYTLVFAAPGKHRDVLRAVSRLGYHCHEFVHSVSSSDRQTILGQFANGSLDLLVAIKCLDEGVDVPATRNAYLLASTTNPREFIQRRGRILRRWRDKELADVWDFIVVPDASGGTELALAQSLLRREMPRFAEFSSSAMNRFEAREAIWPFVASYNQLHLMSEKPWEAENLAVASGALDKLERTMTLDEAGGPSG